ncbi:hypothetical protein ACFYR1_46325 [Streptomyces canus]|uniref:hypothetical protein n=1 Tax=Streptomyces canus TaxID=58343 RepID=UPI003697FA06
MSATSRAVKIDSSAEMVKMWSEWASSASKCCVGAIVRDARSEALIAHRLGGGDGLDRSSSTGATGMDEFVRAQVCEVTA